MKYPCPCCGHLVFALSPGSYDICPICWWEDDPVQLRWPDYEGGANSPSLIESQRNVVKHGACEWRLHGVVRGAAVDEPLDEGWRPIDPKLDNFEPRGVHEAAWPSDETTLYYWRETFWRRQQRG